MTFTKSGLGFYLKEKNEIVIEQWYNSLSSTNTCFVKTNLVQEHSASLQLIQQR